jgi:hypothetical protein
MTSYLLGGNKCTTGFKTHLSFGDVEYFEKHILTDTICSNVKFVSCCKKHMWFMRWHFRFSRPRVWRWLSFWGVAPCSLIETDDGGSKHLWNFGQFLQTTRRKIPEDSHLHLWFMFVAQSKRLCLISIQNNWENCVALFKSFVCIDISQMKVWFPYTRECVIFH